MRVKLSDRVLAQNAGHSRFNPQKQTGRWEKKIATNEWKGLRKT